MITWQWGRQLPFPGTPVLTLAPCLQGRWWECPTREFSLSLSSCYYFWTSSASLFRQRHKLRTWRKSVKLRRKWKKHSPNMKINMRTTCRRRLLRRRTQQPQQRHPTRPQQKVNVTTKLGLVGRERMVSNSFFSLYDQLGWVQREGPNPKNFFF